MTHEFVNGVSEQGRKLRHDWNVIDWRAGDLAKFDTTVRLSYEATNSATDFDKTIIDQPVPSSGSAALAVPKCRITNTQAPLTGPNSRFFFPITGSDCVNAEMRALWLDRYSVSTSHDQVGLGFRQSIRASSGLPWAWIMWHDGIFGIESWPNMDTWECGPTGALIQGTSSGSGGGGFDFPNLQVFKTVYFGSKIGNAITLNVGADHGVVVGDNISIQTSEIDDNVIVVTAVGPTWLKATSSTTATNPIYNVGNGKIMNRSVMPYMVAARLIDDTFQGKAWRIGNAEPDWNDSQSAFRMTCPSGVAAPRTRGVLGITAAHLATGLDWVDYGSIWWRSLD